MALIDDIQRQIEEFRGARLPDPPRPTPAGPPISLRDLRRLISNARSMNSTEVAALIAQIQARVSPETLRTLGQIYAAAIAREKASVAKAEADAAAAALAQQRAAEAAAKAAAESAEAAHRAAAEEALRRQNEMIATVNPDAKPASTMGKDLLTLAVLTAPAWATILLLKYGD